VAGLRLLLSADVISAGRAARAGTALRSADAALLLVLLALHLVATAGATVFVRVLLTAPDAPPEAPALALLVLRSSLLVVVAAWLTLPIVTTGLEMRRSRLPPAHLLRFPVGVGVILLYSLGATLLRLPYLVLLATTLVALAPVAWLAHPGAALAAAAIFLLAVVPAAFVVALVLDATLTASRGRALALGLASALMLSVVLVPLVPLRTTGNGLEAVTRWGNVLLASRDGRRGVLPAVADAAPGAAVVAAGAGGARPAPFVHLAGMAAVVLLLSVAAFRRALLEPPRVGARPRGALFSRLARVPGLPDPLAALTEKELTLLLQTMDAALALVVALAAAGAALLGSRATAAAATLILPLNVLLTAALPFNPFGLDRAGVDRYRLAPVAGRQVVLSKNLAFFWLSALVAAPLLVALAARLGLAVAAGVALLHAGYLLACAAWGNVAGLDAAEPRELWNFDSRHQAGGLTSLAVGAVLAAGLVALGAAATWADARLGAAGLALPAAGLAATLGGLLAWRLGLAAAGRDFEASAHELRQRLAR
jgi:hypothetical protein